MVIGRLPGSLKLTDGLPSVIWIIQIVRIWPINSMFIAHTVTPSFQVLEDRIFELSITQFGACILHQMQTSFTHVPKNFWVSWQMSLQIMKLMT